MSTDAIGIGDYGVIPPTTSSMFEDECVGNELVSTHGIVVSMIENDDVYVCEWSISSHFEGANALEKFEEARQHYDFEFKFSPQRPMTGGDELSGGDAVLKQQLKKQLRQQKD